MATSSTDLLADALEARNAEAAAALRDGRRMRAERGRAAVLTAAYQLVNAGENATIARIAERAGVSERTVFRYYPDREALMVAVAGELFPIIQPMITDPPPPGDLDVRLRDLVRRRVELTQIGGAFASVIDNFSRTSDLADNLRNLRRQTLREQTRTFLGPEAVTAAGPHLATIDALLDYSTIALLREDRSNDEVIDLLLASIQRLLVD